MNCLFSEFAVSYFWSVVDWATETMENETMDKGERTVHKKGWLLKEHQHIVTIVK